MKRVLGILAVLLLAVGIGWSQGAFTFGSPAQAGEKAEADKEATAHPDFDYVVLDPLMVPVITVKGLTQQVSLLVSLEVDYADKDDIAFYKPRLADAYLQDLYGALGAGAGLMRGNVVDVHVIKERLASVTDKVLGPEHKVRDVLLQVVQQRQL